MKFFTLIFLLSVAACSNVHSHVYNYRSQIYTSQNVSEFEMTHFQKFAGDKILVIDKDEGKKADASLRKTEIERICTENFLQCKYLKFTDYSKQVEAQFLAAFKSFGSSKIMVLTESPDTTALFVGAIDLKVYGGTSESLGKIFADLKVSNSEGLKKTLIAE